MKALALIITILALSAPLAANAADWTVSEQLAGNGGNASSATETRRDSACTCNVSRTRVPASDPYVIHG